MITSIYLDTMAVSLLRRFFSKSMKLIVLLFRKKTETVLSREFNNNLRLCP